MRHRATASRYHAAAFAPRRHPSSPSSCPCPPSIDAVRILATLLACALVGRRRLPRCCIPAAALDGIGHRCSRSRVGLHRRGADGQLHAAAQCGAVRRSGLALGLYFTPQMVGLVWPGCGGPSSWQSPGHWAWAGCSRRGCCRPPHAKRMPHVLARSMRATTYFSGAIGGASEMTLLAERAGARRSGGRGPQPAAGAGHGGDSLRHAMERASTGSSSCASPAATRCAGAGSRLLVLGALRRAARAAGHGAHQSLVHRAAAGVRGLRRGGRGALGRAGLAVEHGPAA